MDVQTLNRFSRFLRLGRNDRVLKLIRVVVASKPRPAKGGPLPSTPPRGINPKAEGIWRTVLEKHGSSIYASEDAGKQWGLAIVAFVRSCEKREIEPYTKGVKRAAFVRKVLKAAAKDLLLTSKKWKNAEFVGDFYSPRLDLIGRKGIEGTITVNLRTSPCIQVVCSYPDGSSRKRTFGRATVDEVNLSELFSRVLTWLDKE